MLSTHISDENKAKSISKALNTSYYHHGYAVSRHEAKEMGLNIIYPESKLENLLWKLWEDFSYEMKCDSSFDVIKEIMEDSDANREINTVPIVNLPANTPPQIAQQIIAQHAQQTPISTRSSIKRNFLIAAVESTYFAKAVYNNIDIIFWRNADMSLGANIIEINFVKEEKYKKITVDGYTATDIIKNISLLDPSKKFIAGKTLIFFDEITEFPEIATSLKFFKEDGRFDIICSGSMLGVNYKKIESNSVGNKTDYEMFSMDFEEFLWAKGYTIETIDDMLSHMKTFTPFSELEMSVFHSLFLDYVILGGMPDVVKNYIEKGTFEGSLITQKQLIADYKEDIRKYAEGLDQARILNVFNSIPSQLAKENKKFQLSKVEKDARFRDYRGCAEWLVDAGIVNVCYCLNDVELPLSGNCDTDKFKLYFCDTGLLVSLLDEESQEDLRANKNLGVYKGALYENIVGEALVKEG